MLHIENLTVNVSQGPSALSRAFIDALLRNSADDKENQHSDEDAVDSFAVAMKEKLATARSKGRGGWDDPEQCPVESLSALLHGHVAKGDPVDVANFCMMLHQRGGSILTPVAASAAPKVGEYWLGQGGIYAGMARGRDGEADYPLILSTEAPGRDFKWQDALDHAKTITADGHSDFTVPTRFESALLYANLQDQFDTDYSYWTSTQFSEYYAWVQDFSVGGQYDDYKDYKDYERRVRFVRRSSIL